VLVGGGASPLCISEWLKIPVLEETRRPVDLRLGVLFRGTFHFRGFNNHDEGDEKWLREREQIDDSPLDPQVLSAIRLFAERGEQSIIFTSTKKSAVGLAGYLAKKLDLQPAKKSISGLDDLPPSVLNEILGECFYGGTGFHHAELDQDQRELVESGFRSGEIGILVSTSTLAWGVNLPAKNVFIESMKYSGFGACNCRETLIPLSAVDFSQAAGRAGRIGCGKDYGRAILSAKSPFENEVLWENYIYGQATAVSAGLTDSQLPEFLARLIACGAVDTRHQAEDTILETFFSKLAGDHDHISKAISTSLEFLEKSALLYSDSGGRLSVTELGNILSSSGFSAGSMVDIHEKKIKNEFSCVYDWLFYSYGLPEWRANCGNYFLNQVSSDDLFQRLNELSGGAFENSDILHSRLSDSGNGTIDRRLFEMLFALEWSSGRPTRDLEILFGRGAGGLRQDAQLLCWIINTASKVIGIAGSSECDNKTLAGDLSAFAARMKYGLAGERIILASACGLDREFVNRLCDFGIRNPEDIKNADFSFLREILPVRVASEIFRKIGDHDTKRHSENVVLSNKGADDIVFTQDKGRLKRELKIDGRSILLQPRLYSYFQKLMWGVKSDNPWVSRENLEPGINQPKYISKLRRVLKEYNINIKIISDGAGRYRLLLPERGH
jgi:helicase